MVRKISKLIKRHHHELNRFIITDSRNRNRINRRARRKRRKTVGNRNGLR
ncbi:hypothetical protein Hanom_Chr06g00575401 [Helianthus anomalus]